MAKRPIKKEDVPTTGHSWDGIQEFDDPMPRWWLAAIGLLGIGVGIITFSSPGLTALTLLAFIGAWEACCSMDCN